MYITRPQSMPKDSSTHRLSLPPLQILVSSGTPSTSFYIVNLFLNCPHALTSSLYPSMFANFFSNKVLKLHSIIKSNSTNTSLHFQPRHIPPNITVFTPVSREQLSELISQSSETFCDLDPIPTSILKQYLHLLLPTITDIVNLSFTTGIFPKQFKLSSDIPLLRKYNLDKEDLSNYRPISHLSFLSKLTERVAKQRLTHHLSSNHLLNSFQSAYTVYHSFYS